MNHTATYLKLIGTTFFWAAVFHIGKYAVEVVTPLYASAWRFTLAALVLLPLIAWREGWSFKALRGSAFGLAIMATVGIFGFNVCMFYGLRETTAVNGALIMAFNPALTALAAALINREPLSRRQVTGLLLGVLGVMVVVSKGSWQTLAHMSFSRGDLLIMLASMCWAIYPVIPKRFVRGLSTMQVTGSTITGGAALMSAFAMATTPTFFNLPPLPIVISIIFMGLCGSVLAYLWWNQGVQKLGATSVAVFLNLVPIFTALIGVALGQAISLAHVIGALLVIIGVLYSSGKLQLQAPAWFQARVKPSASLAQNDK